MRRWCCVVLAGVFGAAAVASGAEAPVVFVIPGKAGVPVIINGVDASFTVVEGDVGLSRPGHLTPQIVTPPLRGPGAGFYFYGGYFPARGISPGRGRYEIIPEGKRHQLPNPESFKREWSTQSRSAPADIDAAAEEPEVELEARGEQPMSKPARRRAK
jgi:hypothetical protein